MRALRLPILTQAHEGTVRPARRNGTGTFCPDRACLLPATDPVRGAALPPPPLFGRIYWCGADKRTYGDGVVTHPHPPWPRFCDCRRWPFEPLRTATSLHAAPFRKSFIRVTDGIPSDHRCTLVRQWEPFAGRELRCSGRILQEADLHCARSS